MAKHGGNIERKKREGEMILEPRHLQAAAMLAEGATYDQAGKAAQVHAQTVRGWMDRYPEFRKEIERRALESADRISLLATTARLDMMDLAANVGPTLEEALQAVKMNGTPDWPNRIKAAEVILKHGIPAKADGDEGRANAQAAVIVINRDDLTPAIEAKNNGVIEAKVVEDSSD